jgi:hypothetical protein
MTRARRALIHALVLVLFASCSNDGDSTNGSLVSAGSGNEASTTESETETDVGEAGCSGDHTAQVASFCEAQFPPAPGPGDPGGICNTDPDCESEFCYQNPNGAPFCSALCTSDADCAYGFECGDSGTGLGLICLRKGLPSCGYLADSPGECVTVLLDQLDAQCNAGCESLAVEWLSCIDSIAPICWTTEVDDACGIDLALLEDCCDCTIA